MTKAKSKNVDRVSPPTSITVGPHVYAVHYDRAAWEAGVAAGVVDDAAIGHSNHDTGEIHIRPHNRGGTAAMSDSQTKSTVLHEVVHCLLNTGSVNLTVLREATTDLDLEEWVAGQLENTLLQALRDNPAMVSWLVSFP